MQTHTTEVTPLTRRQLPALSLVPREPIGRLRLIGSDEDSIELPLTQRRFLIGSGVCDIVVPRRLSSAVSACHAAMERDGNGFVVRDLGSKNGTFPTLNGPPCAVFRVEPGDTFWVADVPVAVTDTTLDVLRAHLICHLGILADAAVEEAVRDVAAGHPLLLVGPEGTGARRLAGYIHDTSPQRANARIVGVPPTCLLHHAQGASVYIELDGLPPLMAPYAAKLFDPATGVRPIFAARDERSVRRCLDHYRDRLRIIQLVPLARRREDVPHLMQLHWATVMRTLHRVDDLGPDALAALVAYGWPRNLDELYDHSRRILAYHVHGGLRPAAAALGITHQTLSGHFNRIRLPVLDQGARELPLRPRRRANA